MPQIINAIFISNTNISALIVLIILTLLALLGTYSTNFKKLEKFSKQSPAILATVGVFFSFWGISIGLIEFDATHMAESTPKLLEGLKVKFIASLMGIGFSIIVRIAQSFKLENVLSNNVDNEQKIINLFKELNDSISILPIEFKKQGLVLEAIKTSLAGEGDASVTTQLGKVRIEIRDSVDNQNKILNDKFNNLTDKFDKFAESMVKNNQEALIEALKDVMRDFNAKINEQFGDNFKQLNEAVGNLLIWQENYRIHIERLENGFNIALSSVETIKIAFGEIEARSEKFTATSETLQNILISLDRQLNDLDNHLNAFNELAGNAKSAFPIIEDNLVKLTNGFNDSTKKSLFDINETVKDVSNNLKNTSNEFRATSEKFSGMASSVEKSVKAQEVILTGVSDNFKITVNKTLHDLAENSKTSIQAYERELQRAVQDQMNHISNSVKSSSEQFNKLLTENTIKSTSVLEQQTKLLDTALQEELKKAIETMGSHLASLSNKFVQDYNPLTERLRDIVRMSEDLKRGRN